MCRHEEKAFKSRLCFSRLSVYVAPLLKSNHKIFVFTRKMLSSVPLFTFRPNFSCAGKYLIYEPVSLDSVWKLMSQWRDVSAAFWLCEAQQTTWLISFVLTLWLMISMPVAHLNADHNLPAQGDIASFSFHWSGLFALALKKEEEKQQLSDPRDRHKKTLWKGKALPRDQL